MSYIKADNEVEQKHFDFLEDLRRSGITNMYGAAPYLRDEFPDDFPESTGFHDTPCGVVMGKWMFLHSYPARILDGPGAEKP